LDRVRQLLRGGASGVVLAGAAGVGKTRLANECLDLAADHGFVALRASATQAAAALPFGAFSPLLPEVVLGVDRTDILRAVTRAIVERGEGNPVALFIDDVHLLDDASAALSHQLIRRPEVFLLATHRSGEPAPDAVLNIWKDGLAERVDVEPLSEPDVDELLSKVLGGPLDGGARRLLWVRSGGNVLFLRELLVAAVEAGILRAEDGLWRIHGALPSSARLVEILETRLAGLEPPERETLQLLALAQPLGVEMLQRLTFGDIEALEQRGLIVSERDGRRLQLRLAHPLYGEILRSRMTPLRASAVSRALADAHEGTTARRHDDALRQATWRLEGGGTVQAVTMLEGARRARMLFELELAERLARAAIAADPSFDARQLLCEVLVVQGLYDEADDELSALAAVVKQGDETQRARVALMRIDNFALGGRPEEAMIALLEAEEDIDDPYWRDQLAVERAMFAILGGFTDVSAELVEPLLPRVTGPTLVTACLVAGQAFGLQGRLADSLAATDLGLAGCKRQGTTHLSWDPAMLVMGAARARVWAGELAEAETISVAGYHEALSQGSIDAQGYYSGAVAQCRLVQGRMASALRWAQQSVGLLRPLGRKLYYHRALQQLIEALAMTGQADEATRVLDELEATSVDMFHWEDAEIERAKGWIAAARGDTSEAYRSFLEAAAIAARSGDRVLESAALHDLARFGHAGEVAGRLGELAAVIEGPLAPARAAHAAALAGNDPSGLEHASAAFEAMGAILFAAEAAAEAAVAWRRSGATRKAVAAEQRAATLAARCDGAKTPALTTTVTTRAVLSDRELEIAKLAASGITNKEIAARLCLSLHTIENRLHTIYEKLGINGRAQLRATLEGH